MSARLRGWVVAGAALALGAGVWARAPQAETPDPPLSVYDDGRVRTNVRADLKITDGTLVPSGKLEAVVGITTGNLTYPRCTGTLIKGDVVLTAAHCVCGVVIGSHGLPNSNVLVGIGPDDARRKYYLVTGFWSAMTCRGGRPVGDRRGRDIGVLRLRNPVDTQPIGLAAAGAIDAASSFEVAGFGAIDHDGKLYDYKKRMAEIPAASNACLGKRDGVADRDVYGCKPGAEIVAGQRRSPDTCRGDSGGPLFVAVDGGYRLAGVTSRSIPNTPTICGYGGVYERLGPSAMALINRGLSVIKPGSRL